MEFNKKTEFQIHSIFFTDLIRNNLLKDYSYPIKGFKYLISF